MSELTDDILLAWQQQIARGDERGFDQLFRHFYLHLVSFAVDLVKVRPVAEEIVSDVFVKVWQKKADILLIEKLKIFLFVAVRNQCYNYLRKHSLWNVTVSPDNVAILSNAYNPEEDMAFRELQHRLNQAVEQLPDQCKQVFKLVKEDGLKYKEVAVILGISPRTVETQLFRAVKKLRKVLSEDHPSQQPDAPDILLPVVLVSWFFSS
jgi:RNA polymerase sigma-70 factor (family 1)